VAVENLGSNHRLSPVWILIHYESHTLLLKEGGEHTRTVRVLLVWWATEELSLVYALNGYFLRSKFNGVMTKRRVNQHSAQSTWELPGPPMRDSNAILISNVISSGYLNSTHGMAVRYATICRHITAPPPSFVSWNPSLWQLFCIHLSCQLALAHAKSLRQDEPNG